MKNEKGETLFVRLIEQDEIMVEFEPTPETTIGDLTKTEELLNKMSGGKYKFKVSTVWVKEGADHG